MATLINITIPSRLVDNGLAGHSRGGGAGLDNGHAVQSRGGVARVPRHAAVALGLGIGSGAGGGELFGVVGLAGRRGIIRDTFVRAEDEAVVALIIFLCTRTISDYYNIFGRQIWYSTVCSFFSANIFRTTSEETRVPKFVGGFPSFKIRTTGIGGVVTFAICFMNDAKINRDENTKLVSGAVQQKDTILDVWV